MLVYTGETEAQGESRISKNPHNWVAEGAAPGVLRTPTHHEVPLPVPVHATEAEGQEEGEGGGHQDERQDPHGQHFRAARKETGALASGEAQAGGSGGGGGCGLVGVPPAQPALCRCSATEAHCLRGYRGARHGPEEEGMVCTPHTMFECGEETVG